MVVAIIPARGGSKRIPEKNIKPFLGKPIIGYSIEAAKESRLFDRIIVSTDSKRIAEISKEYGAEVPFYRSEELSADESAVSLVIEHALGWLKENGAPTKYACCIFATAPFILPKYIRQGFEILREKGASSIFSVTTFSFPVFKAFKIKDDGHLERLWPEYSAIPSNQLPQAYHDAAQFYWLNCKIFLEKRNIITPDAVPVIIPRFLVQDINSLEDWNTAERMYKALKTEQKIN